MIPFSELWIILVLLYYYYLAYRRGVEGGVRRAQAESREHHVRRKWTRAPRVTFAKPVQTLIRTVRAPDRSQQLAGLIEERILTWSSADLEIWNVAKVVFDREQDNFRRVRQDPGMDLFTATKALNVAAQKLMEADSALRLKERRGRILLAAIENFLDLN
jgi:hypothetical protein